jgi:hypothetical protein
MSIQLGDIGRPIYIATTFDLSGNTELEAKFSLNDVSFTKTKTADGVSAPAIDSPVLPGNPATGFDGGVLPANTYMLYTTVAGDFAEGGAGLWTTCAAYTDGTPKYYQAKTKGLLEIGDAC